MQFALLTTIAALAVGANAAALLRRQGTTNPRLAQFRVFSDYGCSKLNEGFYTVDQDQSNACQPFNTTGTANGYVSIELQVLESAGSDCKLYLYSDAGCTETETEAPLGACEDATVKAAGAKFGNWDSWQLKCGAAASRTEQPAYPAQN